MILLSLYAKNFMKYEELEIPSFPQQGIIGIVGPNESGKSTILDAISYAVFGRTMKADEQSVARLIHWRSSELEVGLEFELGSERYRIVRRADRQGGRQSLLYRLENGKKELLCEGVLAVLQKMEKIYPVDFEVYRQSFYLGQKELSHLYEKRIPNSVELMEEMTGLGKLKDVHEKVKSSLPGLEKNLIDLERNLSICDVKIENFEERISRKDSLEKELDRQKQRHDETRDLRKIEEEKVQFQEKFRQELNSISHQYQCLKTSFLGVSHKKRLEREAFRFKGLYSFLEEKIKVISDEICNLKTEIQQKESCISVSNELFSDLKILLSLLQERKNQIDRNSRSQFGSRNIKSYFSPETLKDREVLITHQIETLQKENSQNLSHYKLAAFTGLVLVLGVIALIWKIDHTAGQIAALAFRFKLGMGMFLISFAVLISFVMQAKKKMIKDGRELLQKLQMNLSVIERELQDESDEMRKLSVFSLESIDSFEALVGFRQVLRYEPLKKVFEEIILKYENQRELFTVRLDSFHEFEEKISGLVSELKNKMVELESLRQQETQYAVLSKEVASWSFVLQKEPSCDSSGNLFKDLLETSGLIFRLKEILKGDFSHDMDQYETRLRSYRESLSSLNRYTENESHLLPDIWDEKRMEWDWNPDKSLELPLDVFLHKARALEEQDDYLHNLKMAWFEKFQKNKEVLLTEIFSQKTAEQRIRFLEEMLGEITPLEKRRQEVLEQKEKMHGEILVKTRELKKARLLEEMLAGTVETVQTRLMPNLSRFIGSILPEITDRRYSRVRVSEDLEIEVYSPEREGWVDFTALSGGTADQLLICLRMAFASSLLQANFDANTFQFLCMDEPMYAFDSKRSEQFLKVLMEFNPNFSQVFLITHNHNLIDYFDVRIEAQTGVSRLKTVCCAV